MPLMGMKMKSPRLRAAVPLSNEILRRFLLSTKTLVRLCMLFLLVMDGYGQSTKTRNVIFVMTDGLRWQELFRGADAGLMTKENGVEDAGELKRLFWRESAQERRESLMPFLWQVMGKQGQIFGNRDKGANVFVTNGLNFSYPGYNETFSGYPDSRIHSNDNVPNPNVTIFEWLNRKPAYKGKVGVFGAWNVIANAANAARGGFVANSGYEPFTLAPVTPVLAVFVQTCRRRSHVNVQCPCAW